MQFIIAAATNGGYFVRAQQSAEVVFAGTLAQCLDYIKNVLDPPRPAREL